MNAEGARVFIFCLFGPFFFVTRQAGFLLLGRDRLATADFFVDF